MNITLDDIARRAGVSRATASRVINNHPHVNPAVRERVWQAIRETNYQPNLPARSLASRRSQVIGIIIPQSIHTLFADPYFPLLIEGIAHVCNERQFSIMLDLATTTDGDPYRHLGRRGFLEGAIVASAVEDQFLLQWLAQETIPVVSVGRIMSQQAIPYVDVNNRHGARMLVEHLLGQGYRRIATITGPMNIVAGRDRFAGYSDALYAAGLPVMPELVVEGNFSEQSGFSAMQTLLRLVPIPDAVFAASDMMALGALKALRAAGLSVPGDIGLAGFDDIPLAAAMTPALTTVRQPIGELGQTAARLLLDRLVTAPLAPVAQRVMLPTELVIRDSCVRQR
ncbi:LacI family DNA-binding transcriptional regulator [uncultured Chloroflexus sp.]|uniref:LacI family DNA-binding transcriptional regulator n=1 Tax=uncultured Chloroflexus sp. TaxID=214040 RepID=UPI00261CD770|nr:LacI family DNA-binding transcriptional regulator [uncultured Chloroflexus sp.]